MGGFELWCRALAASLAVEAGRRDACTTRDCEASASTFADGSSISALLYCKRAVDLHSANAVVGRWVDSNFGAGLWPASLAVEAGRRGRLHHKC